eukprot:TRINITY_DN39284_c0_g1_i2.p1 TRINITY_DN39284_c0_g1~~TRINITY_DN39284_c0_g1_i2.p1  ORF type:complete len:457 (-),score=66.42 TRINITY_DN39284_c0_g1_i2:74-1444(-)
MARALSVCAQHPAPGARAESSAKTHGSARKPATGGPGKGGGKGRRSRPEISFAGSDIAELGSLLALGPSPLPEDVVKVLKPYLGAWRKKPRLATVVLKALAKEKRAATIFMVLRCMRGRGVEVNILHLNAAMKSWDSEAHPDAQARKQTTSESEEEEETDGPWQLALGILDMLPSIRVMPDIISFNSAMSACLISSQWELALGLLDQMHALPELEPDLTTYNCAMCAFGHAGHWEKALELIQTVRSSKLMPDAFSCSAAINACGAASNWQAALALLFASRQPLPTNEVCYSNGMNACIDAGQWQLALKLFSHMPRAYVHADLISYNCALNACAKATFWQQALDLLCEWINSDAMPSVISMNTAMSACEEAAEWQAALYLLSSMSKFRLRSTENSWNTAVTACDRASQWQRAIGLFVEMRKIGLRPSMVTYSYVIRSCFFNNTLRSLETLQMPAGRH